MIEGDFQRRVNLLAEQQTELCYHCHKCTAGCPVAADMEHGPDTLLRLVQLGLTDEALRSADIWLCAGCQTCGTRCPNGIDIARVVDALREIALVERVPLATRNAALFNQIFMWLVRRTGRMHEMSLLGAYKLASGDLLSDLDAGIGLLRKGKVPALPDRVRRLEEIKKIFETTT